MSIAHPTAAKKTTLTTCGSPDHLFAALDRRRLRVDGLEWRVEVYAIVDQAEQRWIQLSAKGKDRHELTMKLQSQDDPAGVERTLLSWLAIR